MQQWLTGAFVFDAPMIEWIATTVPAFRRRGNTRQFLNLDEGTTPYLYSKENKTLIAATTDRQVTTTVVTQGVE